MTQELPIAPAPKTSLNSRGEQIVSFGFSASRTGISESQMAILLHALTGKTGQVHLGDCIGGDAQIYDAIKATFSGKFKMIGHPPSNDSKRAFKTYDINYAAKPYLERNKDIVECCNVFIGFPNKVQQIGGTWMTINYFRTVLSLEFGLNPPRPIRVGMVVMPNGDVGNIIVEGKTRAQLSINGHKLN